MAQEIVTPKMTIPNTPEWIDSNVRYVQSMTGMIIDECSAVDERISEFLKHESWNVYFNDEPKTWERFLKETIGINDPEVFSLFTCLGKKRESVSPQTPSGTKRSEEDLRGMLKEVCEEEGSDYYQKAESGEMGWSEALKAARVTGKDWLRVGLNRDPRLSADSILEDFSEGLVRKILKFYGEIAGTGQPPNANPVGKLGLRLPKYSKAVAEAIKERYTLEDQRIIIDALKDVVTTQPEQKAGDSAYDDRTESYEEKSEFELREENLKLRDELEYFKSRYKELTRIHTEISSELCHVSELL